MQRDMYLYLHDQTLRHDQPGLHRRRDRRGARDAAGARGAVAHARLLRLGQPQREGRLPALHGLVRRQPRQPVAPPARGGGPPLRRGDGRPRRRARGGPAGLGRRRLPLVRRGGQAPGVRRRHRRPRPARLLADALEQLGFGAENGTWRNAFLAGATELRPGNFGTPVSRPAPDLVDALTVEQVFDSIAVRVDGPRAWDEHLRDRVAHHRRGHHLRHRAAQRRAPPPHGRPTRPAGATTFTLTRLALIGLVTGTLDLGDRAGRRHGDRRRRPRRARDRSSACSHRVDPDFDIVIP